MGQPTKTQKTQQPLLDLNTLPLTQTKTVSHGKKGPHLLKMRHFLKCQELLGKSSADGCCCQDCLLQNPQNPVRVTDSFRPRLSVMGAVQDLNSCLSTLKHNTPSEQGQNIFEGERSLKRQLLHPKY